jgi:nucleotide-binding universal stress UspA family protein
MNARILVPIDDSLAARRAVEEAADLAARLAASITLMTVVVPSTLPGQLIEPAQRAQLEAHFREQGLLALARLLPVAQKTGVTVERKYVEGVPVDEIVAEAGRGYLFVVMGARGAGLAGRERGLMGSVSDRVLRRSPIPVLIVRNAEE